MDDQNNNFESNPIDANTESNSLESQFQADSLDTSSNVADASTTAGEGQGQPTVPNNPHVSQQYAVNNSGNYYYAPMAPPQKSGGPFGLWPTIGIAILAFFISGIASLVAIGILYALRGKLPNPIDLMGFKDFSETGIANNVSVIVSVPFILGVLFLFIKLRSAKFLEYVNLKLPSGREMIATAGTFLIFVLLSIFIFDKIIDEKTAEGGNILFDNVVWPWLAFLGVVIAAPILEEILFRGFIYKGIENSNLGNAGAIVVTSLLWSILHIQYGWVGLTQIYLMGVGLGLMRWHFKSITGAILIHAANNGLAFFAYMLAT